MRFRLVVICVLLASSTALVGAQTKPAAAPAAPPAPAAAGAPMKPGLWETTTLIETAGVNSKRTVTSRTCYSADDIKNVAHVLPPQHEAALKCENRDVKAQGAATDWRIVCTGQGTAMNGSGKFTMSGDSYSAHASLESKAGGKASKVEQTITGKWISDCK